MHTWHYTHSTLYYLANNRCVVDSRGKRYGEEDGEGRREGGREGGREGDQGNGREEMERGNERVKEVD